MDTAVLTDLMALARGEQAADLVIKGGQVANVFLGDTERADIIVKESHIVGLRESGSAPTGGDTVVVDANGMYVLPGLIDSHDLAVQIVDLTVNRRGSEKRQEKS